MGEALTNLVWAGIEDLEQVKCSANWMWAPKLPGEGAAIYDAARAMRDAMVTSASRWTAARTACPWPPWWPARR